MIDFLNKKLNEKSFEKTVKTFGEHAALYGLYLIFINPCINPGINYYIYFQLFH